MSHEIIIIIDKLECARLLVIQLGMTALAKKIEDLKSVAQALQNKLDEGEFNGSDEAHEAMERAEALAIDMCNGNIQNRMNDVVQATQDIEAFLP